MKTTVKTLFQTVKVSDVSKEGKPYINKKGEPFKMLHVQLADGRRASKYFPIDAYVPKIIELEEYEVD